MGGASIHFHMFSLHRWGEHPFLVFLSILRGLDVVLLRENNRPHRMYKFIAIFIFIHRTTFLGEAPTEPRTRRRSNTAHIRILKVRPSTHGTHACRRRCATSPLSSAKRVTQHPICIGHWSILGTH